MGARAFSLFVASVLVSSAPAAFGLSVYTDRSAWEAALAGAQITTETFDQDVAAAQVITTQSGIVSSNIGDNRYEVDNRVATGFYQNAVDPSGAYGSTSIFLELPQSVSAFGGDWISPTSGGGIKLTGMFDAGVSQTPQEIAFNSYVTGEGNGFLGFIGTGTFNSLTIAAVGGSEVFGLDNLGLARKPNSPVAPIPVPMGTGMLILSALACLGFVRKKRAA